MVKRTKVVLRLAGLSIPEKIEKARLIVASMTGNGHFVTPLPPLADITAAVNALEQAAIAAAGGGRDETAVMYEKEIILDNLLTNEALYVEIIANNTPEETASIILGAGMEPKSLAVRQPAGFRVKHGKIPGEVLLRTRYQDNAAYLWQYKVSADTEWINAPQTNKASIVLSGLIPGTRYSFRVAMLKGNSLSAWSDVVELIAL